ncbi:MAG: hypothetical protein KDD27_05830, partial [Saprospiraceae bacterium]|nr:hypothetical protein [Saprospiraceae bacterium]
NIKELGGFCQKYCILSRITGVEAAIFFGAKAVFHIGIILKKPSNTGFFKIKMVKLFFPRY